MLIPKKVLQIYRLCSADSAFAIAGVRFERDEDTNNCRAMATDGRQAVIMKWTEPREADRASLPFEVQEAMSRLRADVRLTVPAGLLKGIDKNVPIVWNDENCPFAVLNETAEKAIASTVNRGRYYTIQEPWISTAYPSVTDVDPSYDEGSDSVSIGAGGGLLCSGLAAMAGSARERNGDSGIRIEVPTCPDKPFRLHGKEGGVEWKLIQMPVALPGGVKAGTAQYGPRMLGVVKTLATYGDRFGEILHGGGNVSPAVEEQFAFAVAEAVKIMATGLFGECVTRNGIGQEVARVAMPRGAGREDNPADVNPAADMPNIATYGTALVGEFRRNMNSLPSLACEVCGKPLADPAVSPDDAWQVRGDELYCMNCPAPQMPERASETDGEN